MTASRASASRKLPGSAGAGRSGRSPPHVPPEHPLPPRSPLSPLHPGGGPLSCCPVPLGPWKGPYCCAAALRLFARGSINSPSAKMKSSNAGLVTARLLEDLTLKQLQPARVAFTNFTPKITQPAFSKGLRAISRAANEMCVSLLHVSRAAEIRPILLVKTWGERGKNQPKTPNILIAKFT